jgi:hypothetical protein
VETVTTEYEKQDMEKYVNQVKKRIAEYEDSDLFCTDQDVVNWEASWADFLFIGEYKGKAVVWNACIETVQSDYIQKVQQMAQDIGYIRYPSDHDLLDCMAECEDKPGYFEYKPRNPDRDRKRLRYIAEHEMEIYDSGDVTTKTYQIKVDEDYQYGVGLEIVVDEQRIKVEEIERFIREFNELRVEGYLASKDVHEVTFTAEDMGVTLPDESPLVRWADNNNPDYSVPMNLTEDDFKFEV